MQLCEGKRLLFTDKYDRAQKAVPVVYARPNMYKDGLHVVLGVDDPEDRYAARTDELIPDWGTNPFDLEDV